MLADVSKALGRSFFIGSFLPALFLVANAIAMADLALDGTIITEEVGFALPICLGGAFVIATMFLSLNLWVVRFYEGYPILRWLLFRRPFQSRRDKLHREIAAIRRKLESQSIQQRSTEDYSRLTCLQVKAEEQYPPADADVLPSKLGNIIRAFEYYPTTRYGIETITIWPRLLAVLPQDRSDAINAEKSLMDFCLNFSLAFLISGPLWALAIWYAEIPRQFIILAVIGSVLLGYLTYRAAIPSAIAWGYEVRTAFDLYRGDLLRKLGLEGPASTSEERRLWGKIFWFFTYEDYAKREGLPVTDSPKRKKKQAS